MLLEFTAGSVHTQKHSAAWKSRLPGIPLLALPSLEGRVRALPEQLIPASYPTCASAPGFVPPEEVRPCGEVTATTSKQYHQQLLLLLSFLFPLQLLSRIASASISHKPGKQGQIFLGSTFCPCAQIMWDATLVSASIACAVAALCSLEHLFSWRNQALTAPW